MVYSTYLGGGGQDWGIGFGGGIAVDADGNAYVTGGTGSTDFPTFSPLQAAHGGGTWDVFVSKLNATGSALVYSTYLGGSGSDHANSIAVDTDGNAYVTGSAGSGFPTTPGAFQTTGGGDAFVTKLNAAGDTLVYSTYLGGNFSDEGKGIAVNGGAAYVTGSTTSTDFPMESPFQDTKAGSDDAFLTKLNATGSDLVYSTYLLYLGGSGYDEGKGIAVDATGNAYVVGSTISDDFPSTVGAFQTDKVGHPDAFVTKFNASGSDLVYSTYLGGCNIPYCSNEGHAIAVDADGNACITGNTDSFVFPTRNPIQATIGGNFDAFVTKLNATGSDLVYSTYLGGSGYDFGYGITVGTGGNVYVTGSTGSTDFPMESPFQAAKGGGDDAFVTKVNATGTALVYSTYLGGSGFDKGKGIAVDTAGSAYITGMTESTDFPTVNPLQTTHAGGANDAFVVKIAPSVQFSANTYSVAENATSVTIAIRSDGIAGEITVDYATSDGTATAGSDYVATSGTITFADGETADKTFTISITDDDLVEGDETINLTLNNPTGNAILGTPNMAVLTITDREPGQLQFSATAYDVYEDGGSATVTVTRSDGSEGEVTVDYATSDGTATAGSDYTATSGTITFADGDTTDKSITIPITDDDLVEGDETINLTLSNPTGGAMLGSPNTAVLTIIDIIPPFAGSYGTPQWTPDGLPVVTADANQHYHQVVSDGAGGVIVVWQDERTDYDEWDIYAQRIDYKGRLLWGENGIPICTAIGGQSSPSVASDGAGGAIIAWGDGRSLDNNNGDIYAQRIDAFGHALWPKDGVPVCVTGRNQGTSVAVSDTKGGAIFIWVEGTAYIRAQRLNSSGTMMWDQDGVVVWQIEPEWYPGYMTDYPAVADGSGGVIVAWRDWRNGYDQNSDIFAQRVDANGNALWTTNGVPICTADWNQASVTMTTDGAGGAIIAWFDYREYNYSNIYAQGIDGNGSVQWPANGAIVCPQPTTQRHPKIVTDGTRGAIVAWEVGINEAIYSQRIDRNGNAQWVTEGVLVSGTGGQLWNFEMASDGQGGAVISWVDMWANTSFSVSAQRVHAAGQTLWTQVCAPAVRAGTAHQLASDGAGGAIIAWNSGSGGNYDIYAQRITDDPLAGRKSYSYYDGSPEGYSDWANGDMIAALFEPAPADVPVKLISAVILFTAGTSRGSGFKVHVLSNQDGVPGTDLIPPVGDAAWQVGAVVDLSTYALSLDASGFFIAIECAYPSGGPYLLLDDTSHGHSYFYDAATSNWTVSPYEPYIRAVVEHTSLRPKASFSAEPTTGITPLEIQFTDFSTGNPNGWYWDFGDGVTSTEQNPLHTYTTPGVYSVVLTASNAAGYDTEIEIDYIQVDGTPIADFSAKPLDGAAPLQVQFTDLSTGNPAQWLWNFGDGGTSTEQNSSHTYTQGGRYSVSLTVTNMAGSATEVKTDYIRVWDNPILISGSVEDSTWPAVAADSTGTLHVVWKGRETSVDDIFYAPKPTGQSWLSPVDISNTPGGSHHPDIAVGKSGAIHTVWSDPTPGERQIYYAVKQGVGSWSTPVNISQSYGTCPVIVIDSQNIVHVIWEGSGGIFYAAKLAEESWSSPINIAGDSGTLPGIAIDSEDGVHVVWRGPEASGVYYATKPMGGDWSSPSSITGISGMVWNAPAIAADSEDSLHVVSSVHAFGYRDILYVTKPSGGLWSPPINISNTFGGSSTAPSIAVDGYNSVHVVWDDTDPASQGILYASKLSGIWSGPVSLSGVGGADPDICIDSQGFVHVVWAGSSIFYTAVEIIVPPEVIVNISTILQGGSRPDEGWVVPITIKFFSAGADVLNDTPIEQFDLTTTKSDGTATCQCSVVPDTYDITAVSEHTLMNVKRGAVISGPSTAVDMGTLLEGNANDDGIINISDFGILAVSFMKSEGEEGYDARADFDRNGIINISDFGMLSVNFMKSSPIELP